MKFKLRDKIIFTVIALAILCGSIYVWAATPNDLVVAAGSTVTITGPQTFRNVTLNGKLKLVYSDTGDNNFVKLLNVTGDFTAADGSEIDFSSASGAGTSMPCICVAGKMSGKAKVNVAYKQFEIKKMIEANWDASNDIVLTAYVNGTGPFTIKPAQKHNDGKVYWWNVTSSLDPTPILIDRAEYSKVKNAVVSDSADFWWRNYHGTRIFGGGDRNETSTGSTLNVLLSGDLYGDAKTFCGGGRWFTSGDTLLNVSGKVTNNDYNQAYFYGGGMYAQVYGTSSVVFNADLASNTSNKGFKRFWVFGGITAYEQTSNKYGNSSVTIKNTGNGMLGVVCGGSFIQNDPDVGDNTSVPTYVTSKKSSVTVEGGKIRRIFGGGYIDAEYSKALKSMKITDGIDIAMKGGLVSHDIHGLGVIDVTPFTSSVVGLDKGTNILGTDGTVRINVTGGDLNSRYVDGGGSFWGGDEPNDSAVNYNAQMYAKAVDISVTGGNNIKGVIGGGRIFIPVNQSTSKLDERIGSVKIVIGKGIKLLSKLVGGMQIFTGYSYSDRNDEYPVALKGSASGIISGDVDMTLEDGAQVNDAIFLGGYNEDEYITGNVPYNVVNGNATLTVKAGALSNFTGNIYGNGRTTAKILGTSTVIFDSKKGTFKGKIVGVDKVIYKDNSSVTVSSGDATGSGDIEIESGSTVTLDGASTDISNVTVKGTLIVANGATLSADKLTLTPTAKVIVKSSASTVSVDKAVGSDTASTFAYEDGAKASNIKIADDSGLKELIPVTGITFDNTALNLVIGKTGTITATVLPANATVKTLTWTTSDAKVATVAAGKVTAIAAGTATITAKADDSSGITATCAVTVTPVYVTGITLSQSSLAMKTGNTSALTATVTPSDATEKTVTWTSSNTAVATVKDGLVTAVGEGTAEITATAGGKSATCKVTVTKDGGGSSSSSGGGGGCNAGFAGLALLAIVPLFCRKKK